MVHIKTLLATAIIAALGGALVNPAFFSTPAASDLAAAAVSDPAPDTQLQDSAARTIAALQKSIGQLQLENQRLQTLLAGHSQQPTAANAAPNPNTTEQQLQAQLQQLEMEQQLQQANQFSDWILNAQQDNPAFNLNQTLAQNFDQELRDPDWADTQEHHYRNLFSDSTELAEFALRDSQCKSRQCELTVSIGSQEQADQLLEKMNRLLAAQNKKAALVVATEPQTGTSKLYISENPKSFEFN